MRGTAWKAQHPGQDVPDDGAGKCRQEHGGVDRIGSDDLVADGLGNGNTKDERAKEIGRPRAALDIAERILADLEK